MTGNNGLSALPVLRRLGVKRFHLSSTRPAPPLIPRRRTQAFFLQMQVHYQRWLQQHKRIATRQ